MQIKLDNVKFKTLDLDFQIENKKITGIVSNSIHDLIRLNYMLYNNICDEGNIKYSKKYSKKKIGLISISNIYDTINTSVHDFIEIKNPSDELLKIVELKENLFSKDMNELSTTQKIKVLILKCLLDDPDIILVDGILERLDSAIRKKIIKLLINLKKFKEKTIVISTVNIDLIYEFIDNVVIINNGRVVNSGDKFKVYEECTMNEPFVEKIKKAIYNKSNINIGNNDSINELIKAIYREVR